MTPFLTEPGTYRARSGAFVHCRRRPDGTVDVDVEDARGASDPAALDDLVKLSDDPDWPDSPHGDAPALLLFD